MAQAKARDKSVDFAKGIAMIAVSFGHIMPALYGNVDIISKYCFSFELAVFFIASGYLQFGRTERKPREYIIHSAKSLIYPYLTFSIVLFVLTSATSILNDGLRAFWDELPVTISLAVTWGGGACWFFPTFFVSGIIVYFCRRDSKIPSIVKTVVLIVVGAVLCVISEKYGFLREATQSGITQPLFWLWHLLSFISRSIVGASLMMIGCRLKRLAIISAEKPRGGGTSYLPCLF